EFHPQIDKAQRRRQDNLRHAAQLCVAEGLLLRRAETAWRGSWPHRSQRAYPPEIIARHWPPEHQAPWPRQKQRVRIGPQTAPTLAAGECAGGITRRPLRPALSRLATARAFELANSLGVGRGRRQDRR